VYDYTIHNRSDRTVHLAPKDVIILEGILILDDAELRDMMDIKVFVDTDDDIRVIRRIKRDMVSRGRSLDSIINQYLKTVKPMYHQFVEPSKRYADLIVPEGGQNQVAIDLLVTKIKAILAERGLQE
ncbi:uridine kinase, partial [Lacticaseibacillus paracasei]